MYYPDEILDEVRARNDIVDVVSSNVKLTRKGSSYFGLCPFHSEKTASFSVSPSKQIYYCFGCGAGGNVISYVMQYENYSFQEAVQYLAQRAGVQLPETASAGEDQRARDLKATLFDLNKQAAAFYYYQLRSQRGAQGMQYLQGRALSAQTMHDFGLGYADKYSDSLYRYFKGKGIADEILKESGLFVYDEKRGMSDKFWNRVMFPIMDVGSRVIGFGGRVMGDGKPKYLNSPETRIFDKSRNLYGLHIARKSRSKFLIVCEGYMDVISMHQAGFSNAVASLGTALTTQHCALLKRYTDEVVLSYDSDGAGVRAALRAIPMLREAGIRTKVLDLRPYKDPDELIKAEGTEAFKTRLKQARSSFFFELSVLEQDYQMSDPEERTRFLMEVGRRIAGFELEVERESYLQAVARQYHVSIDGMKSMVLRELIKGTPVRKQPEPESVAGGSRQHRAGKGPQSGIEASERLLLTWLCEYPSFYRTLCAYLKPEDFSTAFHQQAAAALYLQCQQGRLDPSAIVSRFSDEEEQRQAAALFSAVVPVENQDQMKKAMRETIRKVAEATLQRRSDTLDATDMETLREILEKKRKLQQIAQLKIDLGEETQ